MARGIDIPVSAVLNNKSVSDALSEAKATLARTDLTADVKVGVAKSQEAILKAQVRDMAKLAGKDAQATIDLKAELDKSTAEKLVLQAKVAADAASKSAKIKPEVDTSFSGKLKSLFSMAGKEGSSAFSGAFNGGLRSPGVLVPGIAAALAVLPGAVAVGGAATGIALGTAIALSTDKTLQAQGKGIVTQLKTTLGDAVRESGFNDALSGAMTQVSAVITKIGPEFKQTFGDVAPLLTPVVNMVSDLASNALPGFNSMLREAQGPLTTFFNSAGKIVGTNLGKFFRELGAGLNDSLPLITDLLTLTTDLLPVLAHFAAGIAKIGSAFDAVAKTPITEVFKWLEDHIPAGNKSIFDLITTTDKARNSANSAAGSYQHFGNQIAAAATLLPPTSTAIWELASHFNTVAGNTKKATSALEQYIGILTSSQAAQASFSQSLVTMSQDQKAVKGSFNGSSAAAIQYRGDLAQVLTTGQSYIDSLKNQQASQKTVTSAVKGTLAQMIPYAAQSAIGRQETLAFAQANGIHASSFNQLKHMMSSATQGAKDNTRATQQGTQAAGNAITEENIWRQKVADATKAMHLSQRQTDDLAASIRSLPAKKRIQILENISGQGKVSILGAVLNGSGSANKGKGYNPLTGPVTGKATGGYISGPGTSTSDSIPARLSNGEYVINAAAVRKVGKKHLDAVNSGALGFASGGLVNGSASGTRVAADNRSLINDTVRYTLPMIQSLSQQAANQAIQALKQAAQGSYTGGLNPTGSGATVQALMKSMAASIGWTGAQWDALNYVEMREAGYNLHARNPSSGAYGLAQGISGPSWYYQYGGNPNTAAGQITAMLRYIATRYGSPIAAAAHERSMNWYSQGGTAMKPPGVPSTDRFLVRVGDGERISSASEVRRSEQQHGPTTEQLLSMVIQRLDQQNMYAAQTSKYTSSVAKNTGGLSPIRGIGR